MSALNQASTGAKISVTGHTEQDVRRKKGLRKKKVLESFPYHQIQNLFKTKRICLAEHIFALALQQTVIYR